MFLILSTLNQLNVEIRSPHRIHQLILSLDNILCPMCFKQQNIHLKLWFSLYGASPLEPKKSARKFLHFLFSQPQKKWLFWHHFVSHSPSPLPKLFPQNMHTNSSTPSSQHHLYFLPFCFEFTASSQISSGIASLRDPKASQPGTEELKPTTTTMKKYPHIPIPSRRSRNF